MSAQARIVVVFAIVALMFGCAGLEPGYETPVVGVSSFRAIPAEGKMVPRFEIGLHIVNPNRTPLKLEGIVYSIILNGHKVLTGATSDLPVIGAYSEGEVTLTATADLLNSIRLLGSLMEQEKDTLTYELDAKLDVGNLRPRIHVQEKGKFSLAGESR